MTSIEQKVELISLFWTTAGVTPDHADNSRFSFEDRVKYNSSAGFKGLGLWHGDLEKTLQRLSLTEMKGIFEDSGMTYLELEFLTDWFLDENLRGASDRVRKNLFEAAAVLGAHHVKVGDFYQRQCPMSQLVDAFGELCAEAKQFDTRIGFEIMGCAVVDTLDKGLSLVESTGASNGGLIIDIYQVVNLGIAYDQLFRIPLDKLIGVELNDGTLPGTPDHDPSTRRLCGEGDYDLRGFISTFQKMGFRGAWAVEVISENLAAMPLEQSSRMAFQTTAKQFIPA